MTAPTTTYSCPARIRRTADKTATEFWIKSPRTHRRLSLILSPYFESLLPARMVSRTTKANAEGRGTAAFTAAELRGFKAVIDSIEAARQHRTFIPSNGHRRGGF